MECLPFWDFGNSPRGVAQRPYLGGVFISPGGGGGGEHSLSSQFIQCVPRSPAFPESAHGSLNFTYLVFSPALPVLGGIGNFPLPLPKLGRS